MIIMGVKTVTDLYGQAVWLVRNDLEAFTRRVAVYLGGHQASRQDVLLALKMPFVSPLQCPALFPSMFTGGRALLFHEFPHLHPLLSGKFHDINPAWQSTYLNGGGWFGDFPLQDLLTVDVKDANKAFLEVLMVMISDDGLGQMVRVLKFDDRSLIPTGQPPLVVLSLVPLPPTA